MSKKPLQMSVARPSRAVSPRQEEAPAPPMVAEVPVVEAPRAVVAEAPPPVISYVAHIPAPVVAPQVVPATRVLGGSTARLEQGVKRIVVDVTPTVHKQVKVKAIDFPGGIKEYILRLLEADGLDLSSQPDFVPRPK